MSKYLCIAAISIRLMARIVPYIGLYIRIVYVCKYVFVIYFAELEKFLALCKQYTIIYIGLCIFGIVFD